MLCRRPGKEKIKGPQNSFYRGVPIVEERPTTNGALGPITASRPRALPNQTSLSTRNQRRSHAIRTEPWVLNLGDITAVNSTLRATVRIALTRTAGSRTHAIFAIFSPRSSVSTISVRCVEDIILEKVPETCIGTLQWMQTQKTYRIVAASLQITGQIPQREGMFALVSVILWEERKKQTLFLPVPENFYRNVTAFYSNATSLRETPSKVRCRIRTRDLRVQRRVRYPLRYDALGVFPTVRFSVGNMTWLPSKFVARCLKHAHVQTARRLA